VVQALARGARFVSTSGQWWHECHHGTLARFHRICNPIPPRAERPAGTELQLKELSSLALARPPRCAPRLDELNESAVAEGRPKGPLTRRSGFGAGGVVDRFWG
jgi:hypothetical protein